MHRLSCPPSKAGAATTLTAYDRPGQVADPLPDLPVAKLNYLCGVSKL
jgi:hypothetical protein